MGLLDKFRKKMSKPKEAGEKTVPSAVEGLQQVTRQSVYRKPANNEPEYKLSQEQREQLIAALEKQYSRFLKVVKKYELPFEFGIHTADSAPTWKQIKKGLNSEILDKIAKLEDPTLLLIPPTPAHNKLRAIRLGTPAESPELPVRIPDSENNELWQGGNPWRSENWRVGIAEGLSNPPGDPKISGDNYEMVQGWLLKYWGEGLDVINDLDTYLILVMKTLTSGKKLDTETLTVLNAKNLKLGSRLAFGQSVQAQPYLGTAHSTTRFRNIRLRPIVWVKAV